MSVCRKFITDATLRNLAKWLRLLGYDTKVFPGKAGREMLRIAQSEDRIVLTRRADMVERQFSGLLYLLPHSDIASQLTAVINKFSIKIEKQKMFTICLKCNKRLQSVALEDVRDMVPVYVFEHCVNFNQCPVCGNIYWEGTHRRNSLQFLQKNKIKVN
ncbi:MAG TPA: Mut7-C RNAse domain-containing protein [Smithellaceae bacterium]|nr:Mut7-C RNAse domain-containing protein [Smithellaceae bacterium]